MKSLVIIIASSLLLTSFAAAQQSAWQWVNPLPQGNLINGVWALDANTAFGVTENGTIVRTSNGGLTWQVERAAAGFTDQLFAIQFASNTTGWVVGEAGRALETTDGGGTWYPINILTTRDLFSLSFISTSTGWVAGSSGAIYKTTDGGSTWSTQSSGTVNTLYSIFFTDSLNGWTCGASGTILRTTNSGATWVPQSSGTTQVLYSIDIIPPGSGWAVGAFGTVLRTVSGGATWTPQTSGSSLSLYSVQFTNYLNGWAVGAYGTILKSTNGGIAWTTQYSGSYDDLFGARFVSATVGWAMGDFGAMVATTDGGTTWTNQSSGVKNNLNGIYFPSTSIGYSVGEEGTIIKSTNGGLSWTQQPTGTFLTLYGTYFANTSLGWAVGDSATVFRTTNGGATWTQQNTHTDPSLYSVHFPNSTNGWAVGDFGTILTSTSGGVTWLAQTSPTTSTLLGVRFANARTGWAVGYGGTIIKTTNSGATWFPQSSGTSFTLYSIEIIDTNNIFVTSDLGAVLKTTDGGTTWSSHSSGVVSSLYDISFYTPTWGWAVGDDGTIVTTTDAGTTWIQQQSGTDNTLWGVQVIPGTTGGLILASGLGGTIICSGISPLPARIWTGSFDSLWTNPSNWNPAGAPQKLDSVYIPSASVNPVIKFLGQQINIASLRIGSGGKLTIHSGLAQLIVKNGIDIDGTLNVDQNSTTEFYTGGDFFVSLSGTFTGGMTTVVMTGNGLLRGSFYNVQIGDETNVVSSGPINIRNNLTLLSNLQLRPIDTLTVFSSDPPAIQGSAIITAGTIKRAIQHGSTQRYQFESPATFIQFLPVGTLPDTIQMTTYPNVKPPGLSDTIFVKRYYSLVAKGGSNYEATMSLHYDTLETSLTVDNLSLFRDSMNVLFNMGSSDFLDSDIVAVVTDSIGQLNGPWYLGRYDYIPPQPFQFIDSLFVSDNGGRKDTLFFGAISGATDSIDASQGEVVLGPVPPAGTFDVRWNITGTQGTQVDMRDLLSVNRSQNVYTCSFQPSSGGYPFLFRWNSSVLPLGTVFLQDKATHGTQFKINMKLQNSFSLSNSSITQIEIIHSAPTFYDFTNGWNLMSLPVTPTSDGRKVTIFPAAISQAFGYNGSYYIADTLKNRKGYWLKFASAQHVPIEGTARNIDTFAVASGWNLIGSISKAVAISSITRVPSSIGANTFYQYSANTGYSFSDSIRPARGYWVKASGSGQLILTGSSNVPKTFARSNPLDQFNKITITDQDGNEQSLYFGYAPNDIDEHDYELPPLPPDKIFDVRFAAGTMVHVLQEASSEANILLSSATYPVRVGWQIIQQGMKGIVLTEPVSGRQLTVPSKATEGSIILRDPSVTTIGLRAVSSQASIPKEFSLKQNYPNPFNPSTIISFDLPVKSNVTLTVFNVLGQQVATLLDGQVYAEGSYSVSMNAANFASGIYFYQLTVHGEGARDFHQVRKMVLLK